MFEYLSAYLSAYTTPAQKQIYLDACQTLVDAGVTDHVFAIDQDLAVAESLDGDILFASINEILLPIYHDKIGEMGLIVGSEVELPLITDIFKALMLVDNFEDLEAINSIMECVEGKEAAMSDLLALLGSYQSSDYLPHMQDVSDELIARIKEIGSKEVIVDDVVDQTAIAAIRYRVDRFLAIEEVDVHRTNDGIKAIDLVRDGLKLGIPHADLLEGRQEFLDDLKKPDVIAIELLAFILISATVEDELMRDFSMELELLHIDPLVRTEAHVVASKLVKAVLNG